jgi:hypothetical protein
MAEIRSGRGETCPRGREPTQERSTGRLARDPELRIRDLADLIGITERATVQILSQLEAAGYLTKTRVGRRNHYTVQGERPLRHPMHNGRQVGEVLRVIEPEIAPAARSKRH